TSAHDRLPCLPSFPTRRSSDLLPGGGESRCRTVIAEGDYQLIFQDVNIRGRNHSGRVPVASGDGSPRLDESRTYQQIVRGGWAYRAAVRPRAVPLIARRHVKRT